MTPANIYDGRMLSLVVPHQGVPLEASWHWDWEIHGTSICLLNDGVDGDESARIPYKLRLRPDEFHAALMRVSSNGSGVGVLSVQLDQHGAAHAVSLRSVDEFGYTFIDPWRGLSLLCSHNNERGIAAQLTPEGSWWVEKGTMLRVAFAAQIWSGIWLAAQGLSSLTSVETLTDGPLFTNFDLRPFSTRPVPGLPGIIEKKFQAVEWVGDVAIRLNVREDGTIEESEVGITREVLKNSNDRRRIGKFIADFLMSMIPPVDRDELDLLIVLIGDVISGPKTPRSGPSHMIRQLDDAVAVMRGERTTARVNLLASRVLVRQAGWGPFERLTFTIGPASVARRPPVSNMPMTPVLLEDKQLNYRWDEYRQWLLEKPNPYLASSMARRTETAAAEQAAVMGRLLGL